MIRDDKRKLIDEAYEKARSQFEEYDSLTSSEIDSFADIGKVLNFFVSGKNPIAEAQKMLQGIPDLNDDEKRYLNEKVSNLFEEYMG